MGIKLPFRHSLVIVEIWAHHIPHMQAWIYIHLTTCSHAQCIHTHIGDREQPSTITPIVAPCEAPSILGTSEMPCKLCFKMQAIQSHACNHRQDCYILVYTIHSGGDSDTMETDNTEQQAGRQLEPQNSEQSKPSLSSNFNLVYICCYVDVYSNHVFV